MDAHGVGGTVGLDLNATTRFLGMCEPTDRTVIRSRFAIASPIRRIRPGRPGLRARSAAVIAVVVTSVVAVSVAAAESFGILPPPDQSRCAPLSANHTVLNIGQEVTLRAGPITSQCGGPASTTRYGWQTTDPSQPSAAIGLIQVHPCVPDAPACVYRARLFTQPGIWQAVGIDGTSPDGGWGASVPYAIRYGRYFGINVDTEYPTGAPNAVALTGDGRHETIGADQAGLFAFAVLPGTYTFSFRIGHKSLHQKVRLKERPGDEIQLTLAPHDVRIG
ncbi:MAG TPA: hypothetical protein VHX62_13075 [Solirubrobacteraceae bacterium]|nr:hypothetical protein [Solirubrobacteraceae bacterium]